jgi:uncharacterized cupredoxin-like copper-binding protein
MTMTGKWMTAVAAMLVSLVLVLAACGGGDETTPEATTAEATTAEQAAGGGPGTPVNIALGTADNEYALTPDPAEVSHGTVTFTVSNGGTIDHEMVVIFTDKGAANLGLDNGEADEAGALEEVNVDAGHAGELTLDLEAGSYALVCNLAGHYAAGMYADFTVK